MEPLIPPPNPGDRLCGRCGEQRTASICRNHGCPDVAFACAGMDGYCCRCYAAARLTEASTERGAAAKGKAA